MTVNNLLDSQVTLQPLERFPLDAVIIFSDILVVPQACRAWNEHSGFLHGIMQKSLFVVSPIVFRLRRPWA
jgi:hypothetical protein